jgi:hypothetical protein
MRYFLCAALAGFACGGAETPEPSTAQKQPPEPALASAKVDKEPEAKPIEDLYETPALPAAKAPAEPITMPEVPDFEVPAMVGDAHRVREMVVQGNPLLDKKVKVRGYIVWIYDCAAAIRTPGMSEKKLRKILREHPENCTRPHFFLADTPKAPEADRIMVVEVPRPIRPDERRVLPKDVVDNWPKVPTLKLGQKVVVSGTWALTSPRGFRDSNGLLVYESIAPAP